jgi:hypothetical protein
MDSKAMPKNLRRFILALMAGAILALTPSAFAQFAAMGPPLPTTVVVTKPAPGQVYGNAQVVTFGVKNKIYKFILKDAYVDDPGQRVRWPDVWQQVQQYRPNFQTQGIDADTFEKLEPGQTLTVRGMYAPLNQTFEVMGSEVGEGTFAPAPHY